MNLDGSKIQAQLRSSINLKIANLGKSLVIDLIGEKRTVRISPDEMLDLLKNDFLYLADGFSNDTTERLQKLTNLGPLKIFCEFNNGKIFECLAFKGQEKLLALCRNSEKYHGLMIIE